MTEIDTTYAELTGRITNLGSYILAIRQDPKAARPWLTLTCPHDTCPDSQTTNLIDNAGPFVRLGPITIEKLSYLAIEHEFNRPGDDGQSQLEDLLAAAATSGADRHRAQGRAELVDRILILRQDLVRRQQAEIYTRETADGPSAGIASARADLYTQFIAALDQVMAGAQD